MRGIDGVTVGVAWLGSLPDSGLTAEGSVDMASKALGPGLPRRCVARMPTGGVFDCLKKRRLRVRGWLSIRLDSPPSWNSEEFHRAWPGNAHGYLGSLPSAAVLDNLGVSFVRLELSCPAQVSEGVSSKLTPPRMHSDQMEFADGFRRRVTVAGLDSMCCSFDRCPV